MWRCPLITQMKKDINIDIMNNKVLIVDDEQDVAAYLMAILENNDYIPYLANSVEHGFKILETVKPDLICLDIMMPKESGMSMYKQLKQDQALKNIPIIIISGVEQDGEFDFRSYIPDESIPKPDCFMEKPIDVGKYLQAIEQLLSSNSSSKKQKEK
jgi:DNA-binding response OmpR family regulator